jgi:hypothetical protein
MYLRVVMFSSYESGQGTCVNDRATRSAEYVEHDRAPHRAK